ncbi:MAG: triose-phosphate isomerase [Campylobacterales bacterium]|nr:triose-phosphate isomerase [Campylobacterales bacterium]
MIFAANFKTNHTRASTKEYVDTLLTKKSLFQNERLYIFPPLSALQKCESDIKIGAQNAYMIQSGAFTGEVGLEQLDEFDINTLIIGHSERRELLGESQTMVAQKFQFFKEHNFEIIYCIGEPLEVRENGEDHVLEYLSTQLEGIDTNYDKIMIAYEPIWAIGTGKSATIAEITSIHNALRKLTQAPLLYGGSVNLENIREIIQIDNVNGVLVGSASLDAKKFLELISLSR